MQRIFDLFVPGRVCLFGEHSDWAGACRRFNSSIRPGQVIIAGTNQGIYAKAEPRSDTLEITSTLPDGTQSTPCVVKMEKDALLELASEGGFYSYAAGVAYYMLTFYEVGGIKLDNYRTTLPVKKGLSSSAAFCVMVARAFNKVYDLKLTTRAEMEAAYQGEILTPSRCGRMDQGCAYGQVPVVMTFDGDLLKTGHLGVRSPLALLIADLQGSKNTIKILADLNHAYPFPEDGISQSVHEYLGPINEGIVARAVTALEAGDAPELGRLMTEAQAQFDAHLIPACPEELTAAKLHAVLADERVRELTFGAKGVGSQGDGCVQFVARDQDSRETLVQYLEQQYGMECFELDLAPPQAVRKAVIPAAGFGTRMFPASKAIKKELFPIITPEGVTKPVLLANIEEAVRAGIEEIAVIVRADDQAFFDQFFNHLPAPDLYNRLPAQARQQCHDLQELGQRITLIPQESQEGFGHAVHCAREWVGNEPFLLMLGDHVYVSDTDEPCAQQLIHAYEANGNRGVVGVHAAPPEDVSHSGTITGTWIDEDQRVLQVRELAEKPNLDYARNNLAAPGLGPDQFLCLNGQYILTPEVFEHLQHDIDADVRDAGEIQLTTALEQLRKTQGLLGYVVAGNHYDTGLPERYLQSLIDLHGRGTK
ncbi:MAG: NTP transferase domain-containing protein [Lentisphaerae bacterium]|jgi:UTP-glucose-1-phosphate uridylyltransferase/galactokinase|nr:NTP transferase domain-containing protein [Lentisphaerota bacterium]MBT4823301.1 NTP transferase domain-containing protein [Lentisphaerota bacterium]MBT5609823.1 NTP transferase domain-containing protein [Lentisphaerota bacterium]MBT7055141.1 NTP transferase domain-containing protein [Lentisphaerota bacterium]MBT7846313.1 NTP transferase domain-containing protein [Lentisphaerota bacterium]